MAKRKLPNLTVALVGRDGGKGWGSRDGEHGGTVELDTVFAVGSLSKLLTSAALLKLRDQGLLDLDRPVAQYVPELAALQHPAADSPPLTLRHILTYTSGMPRQGQLHCAEGADAE